MTGHPHDHPHHAGSHQARGPAHLAPAAHQAAPFVLRVGLTGGIATGKSTVARIFGGLGASVLDADEIAHLLVEKGAPAYARVVEGFGTEILRPDGSIDRAHLGRIVFADPERRGRLESILHPLIREEEAARITRLVESGQGRIIVSNAALLIETGAYRDYHRVVVVHCAPEVQVDRIVKRDGFSEAEARSRIAAQMETREKIKVAHYAIDTTAGFAATETRARAVFRHLQHDLQALSEPL
ncbi:MAG TPA: dephospho-CoA kinase [Candidatus Polarisedimenticolia bacterium]|nr:dephospho-CoA kinase [Candidatus Polarisedimenticolia bacterium]